MNNEQMREIIRSFSYGMTVEQIAEVEELDISVVNKIYADNKDEIEDEIAYNGSKDV